MLYVMCLSKAANIPFQSLQTGTGLKENSKMCLRALMSVHVHMCAFDRFDQEQEEVQPAGYNGLSSAQLESSESSDSTAVKR